MTPSLSLLMISSSVSPTFSMIRSISLCTFGLFFTLNAICIGLFVS